MAMAFVDEEEVWRCPIHPSKRRRHGVCPLCLRDKLINLCQNCAKVRPCDCPNPAEPTELTRSRSLAVSFLRSMSTHKQITQPQPSLPHSSLPPRSNQSSSFWSKLTTTKPKKREKAESDADELSCSRRGRRSGITGGGEEMEKKKIITMMMSRSKSVGIGIFTNFGSLREGGISSEKASSKRWFLSPIKTLKQSKAAKVNNENSPLCRG